VKAAVIKLFEERLMIDTFFLKKFMKFDEKKGKTKAEVVRQMFSIMKNRKQADSYKLHQIKGVIKQYFSYEKAERNLRFLLCLNLLDKELVDKRYKLLDKIKRNFKILDNTLSEVSSYVPVGSIHMIPSKNIPAGFKECNGDWLSINAYAELYHVLRDTFGEIDTTKGKEFKLPDYRGHFLRGMTHNRFFATSENDTTRLPRNSFIISNNGGHNHLGNISNAGNHNHSGNISNAGSHSHSGNTAYAGDHAHAYTMYEGYTQRFKNSDAPPASMDDVQPQQKTTSASGAHSHALAIDNNGEHCHTLTIDNNGNHSHPLTINNSGDHTHALTGGDPETRPENYPVTYMIKF
jgi:microcystin-dependent protein